MMRPHHKVSKAPGEPLTLDTFAEHCIDAVLAKYRRTHEGRVTKRGKKILSLLRAGHGEEKEGEEE